MSESEKNRWNFLNPNSIDSFDQSKVNNPNPIDLDPNWLESKLIQVQIDTNPIWSEPKLVWIQIDPNPNWPIIIQSLKLNIF